MWLVNHLTFVFICNDIKELTSHEHFFSLEESYVTFFRLMGLIMDIPFHAFNPRIKVNTEWRSMLVCRDEGVGRRVWDHGVNLFFPTCFVFRS